MLYNFRSQGVTFEGGLVIQVLLYYNNVIEQRQGCMSTSVLVGVFLDSLYVLINVTTADFVASCDIQFLCHALRHKADWEARMTRRLPHGAWMGHGATVRGSHADAQRSRANTQRAQASYSRTHEDLRKRQRNRCSGVAVPEPEEVGLMFLEAPDRPVFRVALV